LTAGRFNWSPMNQLDSKLVYTNRARSRIIREPWFFIRDLQGYADWLKFASRFGGFAGRSGKIETRASNNQRMASFSFFVKGHTMTAKVAETQLWQQNLASLIRSGLFSKAATGELNGLFTVVGVYADQTCSAPLAKYSDLRRATDAANLVNRIATIAGSIESN
jgi:hypothetical protein